MEKQKELEEKLRCASPKECAKLVRKLIKIKVYERRKKGKSFSENLRSL